MACLERKKLKEAVEILRGVRIKGWTRAGICFFAMLTAICLYILVVVGTAQLLVDFLRLECA
jgi:hypothetical protein